MLHREVILQFHEVSGRSLTIDVVNRDTGKDLQELQSRNRESE